jgi:glycosyltransferase involved in cell wall biosynthesis
MNKICMLSTGHGPMDDRIFYKESLSLSKRYKQIYLVTPGKPSDFRWDGSGIEYIPVKKSSSLLSRFTVLPALLRTVLKLHPDVIHFHDYEIIFLLPFFRLMSKSILIYDSHECYPEMVLQSQRIPRMLRPLASLLVRASERVAASLVHHVITPVDDISERFRRGTRHVSTIFNYPRLSIFMPDEKALAVLKERYRGRIPILYQGGITEDRGLFQMIKAMEILKAENAAIILLLVGPVEECLLQMAKSEISRRGLESHVDMVGSVPHREVANYMLISRIGLVPLMPTVKYMISIPIKQFEYMACGVPVLGSNLPLIASYVKAAGCGRIFEPHRPEALAAEVMAIIEDEKEWRRMSEAGKKAVRELWNWDRMEERLLSVYDHLLRGEGCREGN